MDKEGFLNKINLILNDMDIVDFVEEATTNKPFVNIIYYTAKSFAVIGNTIPIKDELKKLGGKYNANLKNPEDKDGVNKIAGWIFSISKKSIVDEYIKDINSKVVYKLIFKKK